MNSSVKISVRSPVQWLVVIVFGLLGAVFFLRALQLGTKWVRHVAEGDLNFKALTLWALVYAVICVAIAAVAYRLPPMEKSAE